MGTTLIISAWKMLCLCVSAKCVCVCVRVIKVKCWCLVNRTASLECIYTHTVWPAVTEMCSFSSWIDPEDRNTTAASNSTFSSASLCVPPPHLDLCPLSLLSFTFRGSWRAVCKCSSINWVPNWLLLLAVVFLDPFNRYSKKTLIDSHLTGVKKGGKKAAKIIVKYFISVSSHGCNMFVRLLSF